MPFGIPGMLVENPRKKKHQDSLFSHNQEKEIDVQTLRIATPFQRISATLLNILPPVFFSFLGGMFYYNADYQLGDLLIWSIPLWFVMQLVLMLVLRQTFGKWLMKIKVVDMNTRKKISFCRYLIRELVGILLYIAFPFNIVMDLFILLKNGDLYTFSRNLVSSAVVSTYLTDEASKAVSITQ